MYAELTPIIEPIQQLYIELLSIACQIFKNKNTKGEQVEKRVWNCGGLR